MGELGLGAKGCPGDCFTGLSPADPEQVLDQLSRAVALRALGPHLSQGQSSEGLHLTQARLSQDSSHTVCFSSPLSALAAVVDGHAAKQKPTA